MKEYSMQQAARLAGAHWTTMQRRLRASHGRPFTVHGMTMRGVKDEAEGRWRVEVEDDQVPTSNDAERLLRVHLSAVRQALASAQSHLTAIESLLEASPAEEA